MTVTSTDRSWRIVPYETARRTGRRCAALAAQDAHGNTAAIARFDGPGTGDAGVELSLQLGPVHPPAEVVGELVSSAATLAAEAGADRVMVDFDPRCPFARDVLAASELDWHVRSTPDAANAQAVIGEPQPATAPQAPRAGSISLVRTHPKGVTVLPSAEGSSLRSDPRWTARRAHRSAQLLERLISRGRSRRATRRVSRRA